MQFGRRSWAVVFVLASACGGGDVAGNPGGGLGDGSSGGDGFGGDASDGSGSTDGTGDGNSNEPSDPDGDGVCEAFGIATEQAIPDMLIVLDRSGSMGPREETGFVDRWNPSRNAVNSLAEEYGQKVRFGLMLFPSDNACGSGELLVPVTLNSAQDIEAALFLQQPGGGTPTSATLERAFDVLGAGKAPLPDTIPTVKFVMLVTDGQPTCPAAGGAVDPQDKNDPAEVAAHQQLLQKDYERTLDSIDALSEAGVKTYVIGYDADLDPVLSAALSAFADHGGTGDYHPVQNEAELNAEFDKISGEVVSCSYTLEQKPQDPSYVEITLDGNALFLDNPDGWSIDAQTVTIQGDACRILQDGGDHELSVRVLCDQVIPQ